jgi:signal transduction histidine kinase
LVRWSLRNQILVPLLVIQGVAVMAISVTMATLATRRGEREIINRVSGVIGAVEGTNFPYTSSVLAKMHGLSGAQFIAFAEDGRVVASSLVARSPLPSRLDVASLGAQVGSLGASPTIVLDGTRYLMVRPRSWGNSQASSLLVLYPETAWIQARWDAAFVPLLLGVVSLVLLAGVTCWLAHRISTRIRCVQEQVAQIATGDFHELDLGRSDDEVQDLARSINQMSGELREMRQEVRNTERARILGQLAAGLAHQLRNSLTGARMSVQLHARRFPARDGDRTLEVALRQLAMTEEQVRGLLSLGKVERRAHSIFGVCKLLDDVALLVEPACEHAHVMLKHSPSAGLVEMRGDESGVRAGVLNLTLNAVEAAGPGGQVGLELTTADADVVIEIWDTGPGPPPEIAEDLCEPFVTSKPEGVGLGLALAHQVANEHGGRLSWTRDGGITRFQLRLHGLIGATREVVRV